MVEQQLIASTGAVVGTPQVLYVRVRVQNGETVTAQRVSVVATKIERINANRTVDRLKTFSALPLTWSHFGGTYLDVPRGQFRYIDVGFLREDDNGNAEFLVSTVVQSFGVGTNRTVPNVLEAGTYEIELVISAENARPRTEVWRLSFPSTWVADEARLTAGLSMSKTK